MTNTSTKKNISYNMIYQILVMALPFITAPYLSRVIGSEGVGIYSYTYSIAYYFVLFSMMGLSNYGNRTIAQSRDDSELLNVKFSEIYLMQVMFSVISIIAYIILAFAFGSEYRTILFIQIFYVISASFDISWFFYGIEQFRMMVIRNAVIKILTTICIFIFVRTATDLWKYALIMSLGSLISQLCLWSRLKNFVALKKFLGRIFVNM